MTLPNNHMRNLLIMQRIRFQTWIQFKLLRWKNQPPSTWRALTLAFKNPITWVAFVTVLIAIGLLIPMLTVDWNFWAEAIFHKGDIESKIDPARVIILFGGLAAIALAFWRSSTANRQADVALRQADIAQRGQDLDRYVKAAIGRHLRKRRLRACRFVGEPTGTGRSTIVRTATMTKQRLSVTV